VTAPVHFDPDYALSAGQHLQSVLAGLGMSQSDLAARTGLSAKHINQLIKKNLPISPDTATQLEYATNVDSEIWMSLDARFQSQQAHEKARLRLLNDLDWLDQFNLKELANRRVIPTAAKTVETLEAVLRYFGIADPDGWGRVWLPSMTTFRQSPSFHPDRSATTVWLRAGQLAAKDVPTSLYDPKALVGAVPELRRLTTLDPASALTRTQDVLAEVGVALVFVAEFEKCHASGATWWSSPTKAVIMLSNRGKREDRFWFTLFHEIGHILLHAKRDTFIDANGDTTGDGPPWSGPVPSSGFIDDGSRDSVIEQEADDFASETLIPETFRPQFAHLRTEDDVKRLAKTIGVSEGIVAGRYQFETSNYRRFNPLRRDVPHELFASTAGG
jgi:HTH-type transcriptional regulator/antitoxin HigA